MEPKSTTSLMSRIVVLPENAVSTCVSIERKSYLFWLCITTLRDWSQNRAPVCHPARAKTKLNCDLLAQVPELGFCYKV